MNLQESIRKVLREEMELNQTERVYDYDSKRNTVTERLPFDIDKLVDSKVVFVTPAIDGDPESETYKEWLKESGTHLLSLYNVENSSEDGWIRKAITKKASTKDFKGNFVDKLYDGKYNQILWSLEKLGINPMDMLIDVNLQENIRRILREETNPFKISDPSTRIEEDRVQIVLGRNKENHFGKVQNIIIMVDDQDITSENNVPGLGKMNIVIKDNEIIVGDIFIPEKYRNQGIATVVYQKISDYFGLPVVNSTTKGFNQTMEGGYIWKNREKFEPRNLQENIRRILRENRKPSNFLRRRLGMLDYEVESRFYAIKNRVETYSGIDICVIYGSGERLFEAIMEGSIDVMYYNHFSNIDDNSGEWAHEYLDMVNYIRNKYQHKIMKYYDDNCGSKSIPLKESIRKVLREEKLHATPQELIKNLPKELKELLFKQWGAKQNPEWHPEGNTLKHIIVVIKRAYHHYPDDPNMVMAALFHDLGKIDTYKINPKTNQPTAYGHEDKSTDYVEKFKDWIESFEGMDVEEIKYLVKNHMKVKPSTWDQMKDKKKEPIMSHPAFDKLMGFTDKLDGGGTDLKESIRRIIKEELRSNLTFLNENSSYNFNISYEEFDDINNSVWRKLAHNGNYNDAIDYMNNYLNNNKFNLEEYQIGGILWHIGQLYAFNHNYKKAIKFMSMKNVSDSIEPNYQKGTISYLSRDFKELQKYYNRLAKNDPTGGSGRDILKKFIDNFDKPYKEIY